MRTWSAILVCLALGAGLGWWVADARMSRYPWDGTGAGVADSQVAPEVRSAPKPDSEIGGPRVSIDHDSHDFGAMEQKGAGKHDFTIKNVGTTPLTLTKGASTCRCTLANMDRAEVPPGESTKVTVEWHGKLFDGPYSQSATILTNDPRRPEVTLKITGRIVAQLKATPTSLSFPSLSPTRESTADVKFYSFADAPLTLTQPEWLDPRLADFFTVRLDPMPADELQKEKSAKSGLIARLTIRPGLPIGKFSQTLHLRSNVKDLTEVDLPISGAVVGMITVSGRNWNDEWGILMLGHVPRSAGDETTLWLLCKGPDHDKLKFRIAERSPSFLEAAIDRDERVGAIRRVSVNIRVPKGSPIANHYGGDAGDPLGRVLLETGVPGMPPVLIKVRFAVIN